VVFFAAGFETTTAPVAAMLAEGVPHNLSLLLSGRLTWPAVAMLLNSDTPGFDCLIAPGHVGTVMGPEEWEFVVQEHNLPAAMAGFTPESLLAAMYSVLRQHLEERPFLDNCYPEVVRPGGNPAARRMLDTTLRVVDANWRGVGVIPASGYALAPDYAHLDVRARFPDYTDTARKRAGQMPPGCDCAKVVLGRIYPNECRLYGRACHPAIPSARAWSPMRVPAASGGAAACASGGGTSATGIYVKQFIHTGERNGPEETITMIFSAISALSGVNSIQLAKIQK